MKLDDILRHKGTEVYTTSPNATLADVVQRLVQHNCGSLVVCETGSPKSMVGIITERDILRACAEGCGALESVCVGDVMSRHVITGRRADEVGDIMGLMTKNRIRHLPVVEGGELCGMISIGDVVKAQYDHLTMENHYLKEYIQS